MPAAGRIADSIGADGPSRRQSRLDRTTGTAAGGLGGSRLPTLVRWILIGPKTPRIIKGRAAYPACPAGNYPNGRTVCHAERIKSPRAHKI